MPKVVTVSASLDPELVVGVGVDGAVLVGHRERLPLAVVGVGLAVGAAARIDLLAQQAVAVEGRALAGGHAVNPLGGLRAGVRVVAQELRQRSGGGVLEAGRAGRAAASRRVLHQHGAPVGRVEGAGGGDRVGGRLRDGIARRVEDASS